MLHSDVLFWNGVSATLDADPQLMLEDLKQKGSNDRVSLSAGGWERDWQGKGGITREQIVRHGLHDKLMTYPVVSLAISRAFRSQNEARPLRAVSLKDEWQLPHDLDIFL